MTDKAEPEVQPKVDPPLALTPELARAALAFLDRSQSHGFAEARTLLHLGAVLESIARSGSG